MGWEISCNIKRADGELRHAWLSTKYAEQALYKIRENKEVALKTLKSVKGENKTFWIINNDPFHNSEKKKNPVAKDLASSLGAWVQSLTCEQTLSATFRKSLHLLSSTSLSVK